MDHLNTFLPLEKNDLIEVSGAGFVRLIDLSFSYAAATPLG